MARNNNGTSAVASPKADGEVKRLIEAAQSGDAFARADLDQFKGKDQELLADFNEMLDDMAELRRQGDAAARLQSATEGSATASMQVDTDLILTGANPATLALVAGNLDAFQAAFPQADFNDLVGTSIDVFHKNPAHQRGILGNAANLPHTAEIQVGELKFALSICAMLDGDGNHIGANLEWQDVTAARAEEDVASRLQSAVDGSATASMQVDTDLILTGANPATVALVTGNLDALQTALPQADFNNLVGTSIDVFHKNPALQRRILGNPANLPHTAEIQIGQLRFALSICAMLDAKGTYIGASLEWADVTASKRLQVQQEASNSEINKLVQAAQAGDLTVRAQIGELDGEFETLVSGINSIIETLEGALSQVNNVSVQVAGASSEINEGSQKLAEGASSQAGSVEEISASLEEMTSMTKQNADNAGEAKSLSNTARDSANKGNETMVELQEAMTAIKASSEETAKIVKTIDEISFQTNMLALNAAVEAARAGDAGRGFAVVAEEVRSLAQRSAEAAKNTAELIEGATKNADSGVSIAGTVQKMLGEITDGSGKVNDLITEIAAASKEQADGLTQISTAVDQVNKVTQENSANSEQSSAAAGELNGQVDQLTELLGKFVLSSSTGVPPQAAASTVRPTPARRTASASAGKGHAQIIPLDDDELSDF